jgi:DNA-binding NarL/FixJ family response regulator
MIPELSQVLICVLQRDNLNLEDFSTITQKNPRAEITYKKYRKQTDWRRNKVRELLIRGYSQYEISNTLHLSQPTVSRDIGFIRKQNTSAEKEKTFLTVTIMNNRTLWMV